MTTAAAFSATVFGIMACAVAATHVMVGAAFQLFGL